MKRFRLGAQALALTCALIALPTTLSAAKPETRPAVSTAAIPTDYKEICNALPAKGLQHPYLVFNEAQKPANTSKPTNAPGTSTGCCNSKVSATCA